MKKAILILIYASLHLVLLNLDSSSMNPDSPDEGRQSPRIVRERSPSHTSQEDEQHSGEQGLKEVSDNPKPLEREGTDDFKEDIRQWIPPKTWWETLISITSDRKEAFIKLGLEQELIAAQADIENGLRLQNSGGKGALEYILEEEENKQYLLEKVRKKRAMIRAQIRMARQNELISENEAKQLNEKLLQEESKGTPQSVRSWWRFGGYTEVKVVRKEVGGFVLLPGDRAEDKGLVKDVETVEQDDIICHAKISQYLKDKAPLRDWEEPFARWFWKKGANQIIKKQDNDDQSVAYTQDEIDQLFKDQIQTYQEQETLGAFWGDSIWAYLLEHQESLQELLPSEKIEGLQDDRLYFFPVQTYLRNQTSGDLWRDDRWVWFMKKGHVNFDLGERGVVCGADLIGPLFENRKMLDNFSKLLFENPNLWDVESWRWFEANGRGRTLGTVEITDDLFALMCEQRKEEKDDKIKKPEPSNKKGTTMAITPSKMIPLETIAPDFALTDGLSDQKFTLTDLKSDKATVIVFMCNHCPYVKYVLPGLIQVASKYMEKGVSFVGINSNDIEAYPMDSPQHMKTVGKDLGFPYLFDGTQEVAKAYQAACTPDFFIFDKDLKCVYRGQFDNARPGSGVPATGQDLSEALDAILEGRPVSEDQKPSIGCNIKWKG